jgi:hypothetical protein
VLHSTGRRAGRRGLAAAEAGLRQALAIFQQTGSAGSAQGARVAAKLSALTGEMNAI